MDVVRYLNDHSFTVLFSGGKDSTAALLWVYDYIKHDDWDILHIIVTGNTHPLSVEYVKYVAAELGVLDKLRIVQREINFFDKVREWGPPLIGISRWCLHQFKLKLIKRYARKIQVLGIRNSDSSIRMKLKPIDWSYLTKSITVHPIISWSDEEVYNYIRDHGLDLNPCYDLCGHSGNCMFCPYHDKKAIILTLQDPYWRSKILSALKEGRGPISKEIYRKWIKLSKIQTLERWYG